MHFPYESVLKILEPYLNSKAENFLNRQIKYHLKKTPETLTPDDIADIAKWCRISSSLFLKKNESEEMHQKILEI